MSPPDVSLNGAVNRQDTCPEPNILPPRIIVAENSIYATVFHILCDKINLDDFILPGWIKQESV